MKQFIKKLIPKKVFSFFQPLYHFSIALTGALWYRFPSRNLIVIGITGTKGKSSTAELVWSILQEAGYKTALLSTIHFKIDSDSTPNRLKMTMPGLFFVQNFLRKAVLRKCTHAVIEMTSEGVAQYRHKFIALDALIFTNITPEHIESHGSFENYLNAKLKLRDALAHSSKKNKVTVANADDVHGKDFLDISGVEKIPFSLKNTPYALTATGLELTYKGVVIHSLLEGVFNAENILASVSLAEHLNIPLETIARGVTSVSKIKGRVEHVRTGQLFDVVVDYAHTPDSLKKLYEAFPHKKKICVLGNTGGGRDTWKRPEMGKIAGTYCDMVILTNEDPYDEDPEEIVTAIQKGVAEAQKEARIIMDRRTAIYEACLYAQKTEGAVVLISGKGTDPYIMEARGKKTPWDDVTVATEVLEKIART